MGTLIFFIATQFNLNAIMVNSIRLFFVLLLSLSSPWLTPGISQNYIDLLRIDYAGSSGNAFESGPGTSSIREWQLDANIPVPVSKNNTILTGFLFEHIRVSLYPQQEAVAVKTLGLKFGLNQRYSNKWSGSYFLFPKFASDLKRYESADFQLGIAVLFKLAQQENLHFKFGVLYNTDLFGPFVTPLLGLYFQRAKWEANVLLPSMVDLNYQLVPALKVGLRFNGMIKSFNLNSYFNGMQQYLARANNELGGYLAWSFGKLHLVGMAGRSIGRSYRTYAQDDRIDLGLSALRLGDDRSQLNPDFKDGLVYKFSVLYRLNTGGQ